MIQSEPYSSKCNVGSHCCCSIGPDCCCDTLTMSPYLQCEIMQGDSAVLSWLGDNMAAGKDWVLPHSIKRCHLNVLGSGGRLSEVVQVCSDTTCNTSECGSPFWTVSRIMMNDSSPSKQQPNTAESYTCPQIPLQAVEVRCSLMQKSSARHMLCLWMCHRDGISQV